MAMMDGKSTSAISMDLGITYSHVHRIVDLFQERKWIIIEKQGRINKIKFTTKGNIIKKLCEDLIEELMEELK